MPPILMCFKQALKYCKYCSFVKTFRNSTEINVKLQIRTSFFNSLVKRVPC